MRIWIYLFCLSLCVPLWTDAQEVSSSAPPLENKDQPPLRDLGGGLFEIGKVQFDKNQKTVSFPAWINMNQDLIEYLIVGKGGKLHESLLRTEVQPSHIHLAMLLLGAKGDPKWAQDVSGTSTNETYRSPPFINSTFLKNAPPLEGEEISLWVSWNDGTRENRVRLEDWIFNQQANQPMTRGKWIYNGSVVTKDGFLAQREKSIVAAVTDPSALMNNPRPGHDNDQIWQVNNRVVPPVGTPVQVTIKMEKQ